LVDKLAEYEELYLPQPALGELCYGPKLSLLKLDPVTQARITNLLIRIIKVQ
jgi:hypothetical protein